MSGVWSVRVGLRVSVNHVCVGVWKCVHSGIALCLGVKSLESATDICSLMHLRVEFVLEDVQVVGGGDGDDVLSRVPGRVENLLGEVQAVHADVIFPPLSSSGADPSRFQYSSRFAALSRRLQGHVTFGVPVEHAEEVVVGSCHDDTEQRRRIQSLTSKTLLYLLSTHHRFPAHPPFLLHKIYLM